MTLEAFIRLQQEQYENVLVARTHLTIDVGQLTAQYELVEERHPISPEVLPILKQIWEQQYLLSQSNIGFQDKLVMINRLLENVPPVRAKASKTPELTAKRNHEIYKDYCGRMTVQELSDRYRLNKVTIYAILRPFKRTVMEAEF